MSYEMKVFQITDRIPHDRDFNFTQGLFVKDGKLYESTGLASASGIVVYDLKTKKVVQKTRTPGFFGEGSAIVGDTLYQLSWKDGKVRTYDAKTLEKKESALYAPTDEAWGLASSSKKKGMLWFSDGGSVLYLVDPKDFEIVESHPVMVDNQGLFNLNELEEIDGLVYMNVWFDNYIYAYDPDKKEVVYKIETESVRQEERDAILFDNNNVLNGVAYDAETKTFYITGKGWRYVYAGKIVDAPK